MPVSKKRKKTRGTFVPGRGNPAARQVRGEECGNPICRPDRPAMCPSCERDGDPRTCPNCASAYYVCPGSPTGEHALNGGYVRALSEHVETVTWGYAGEPCPSGGPRHDVGHLTMDADGCPYDGE